MPFITSSPALLLEEKGVVTTLSLGVSLGEGLGGEVTLSSLVGRGEVFFWRAPTGRAVATRQPPHFPFGAQTMAPSLTQIRHGFFCLT